MKSLMVSVAIGACVLISSVGFTFAANPHGPGTTGPPGKTCGTGDAMNFPGNGINPVTSPGSPFDEGVGTGGLNYNEKSQYDVACFQQTPQPSQVP